VPHLSQQGLVKKLLIPTGSKILMIGDSITDCDRARLLGEGGHGLGNGYVNLVNTLLTVSYPGDQFTLINRGVSGNTLKDLSARWQTDVLNQQPDWLSVMIGINDVWRQFDSPGLPSISSVQEFTIIFDKLLTQTIPTVSRIVLMTPFFIEENRLDPIRKMTDIYAERVRQIAHKHNLILIDTQAIFDKLLAKLPDQDLAGDGIHPTKTGHMILAKAFLQAVGYVW
jgi:lysophospholipase L1-like esterase